MAAPATQAGPPVVNFTVRAYGAGCWRVCEQGFEKALAEFADGPMAEQYAMRLAESKPNWKVDVYDAAGELIGTYNSEDDSMPKPGASDAQS
jgi:hypothetical protein